MRVPPVPVIAAGHCRCDTDTDPAHAWLRPELLAALRAILDAASADSADQHLWSDPTARARFM